MLFKILNIIESQASINIGFLGTTGTRVNGHHSVHKLATLRLRNTGSVERHFDSLSALKLGNFTVEESLKLFFFE